MKRIFALCLVLALLAGCAPAPNAPSSGAPASSQTVQEPPAPTFAVGVLDTVQWSGYGTGSNGGDAYYELAVLAENAAGPDGLTRRVSMLLRTDYATLTQAPLCSVPGCGHSDAACPAYIEGKQCSGCGHWRERLPDGLRVWDVVCTKRSLIGGRGLYRRGGRFRRPAQKR